MPRAFSLIYLIERRLRAYMTFATAGNQGSLSPASQVETDLLIEDEGPTVVSVLPDTTHNSCEGLKYACLKAGPGWT
jgi:hypothetical protein